MKAFVDYWNVPGAWDAMSERHQDSFLAVGPKVFAEVMDLFHERSPAEAYDGLTQPTLITVGRHTTPEEAAVCEALASRLESRSLQVFDGGHMVPLSHGPAFNEAARQFLAEPG